MFSSLRVSLLIYLLTLGLSDFYANKMMSCKTEPSRQVLFRDVIFFDLPRLCRLYDSPHFSWTSVFRTLQHISRTVELLHQTCTMPMKWVLPSVYILSLTSVTRMNSLSHNKPELIFCRKSCSCLVT